MPSNAFAVEDTDVILRLTSKWGNEEMKLFISAAIGAVMLAGQAFAATLSVDGGYATTLPSNYNPAPTVSGTGTGTSILTFSQNATAATDTIVGQGLRLTGDGKVTFTFLGEESTANNYAVELATGQSLGNNGVSAAGDNIAADFTDGLVSFRFITDLGGPAAIENGVGASRMTLRMAFHVIDNKRVLAFFGDGAGDSDYDDIVIMISTAPLPAGALLLLTGMGGMGLVRRRRNKATA